MSFPFPFLPPISAMYPQKMHVLNLMANYGSPY